MAQILPTNMICSINLPLDDKTVKANIAARDAIPLTQRYKAMQVMIQNTGAIRPQLFWLPTDNLNAWEEIELGSNSTVTVNDWAANVGYVQNQIIVYDSGLYRCTTTHTSTATFNDSNWELLSSTSGDSSILPYETNFNYTENQTFYDDVTGYIYTVLGDYTSVNIDTDLLNGDIRRIGGGGGTLGTADEVIIGASNGFTIQNPDNINGLNGTIVSDTDDVLKVLKMMLLKATPPTYLAPTLTLSGGTASFEVGTNIQPTLTPTFTQRDGGAAEEYRLYQGAVTTTPIFINTVPAAYQVATAFYLNANQTFNAQVDFAQGPVKVDSLGNLDDNGRINAGTVAATFNFTAYRKAFFGEAPAGTVVDNSSDIRALPQSTTSAPANNTQLVANISVGGGRVIAFAYPATLRDATSIIDGGLNVISGYTRIIVNVEGANNQSPISYKVYYTTSAAGASTTRTVTMTI